MNHLVHMLSLATVFSQIILQYSLLIVRRGQARPTPICHTHFQLNAFFFPPLSAQPSLLASLLCAFNFAWDTGFQKAEEMSIKKKSH